MKNYINKIRSIFPKSKNKAFFNILLLNLINTFMEVFNIAMVIPLFTIILEKTDRLQKYNIIPKLFFELNHYNQILLVIVLILSIYIAKVFFYVFGHYYLSSKVYQIGASVGNKMVTKYIVAPFEFHIYKNSSYMIRNVYKEANEFIESIIRPGFYLINDILILSGILLFLLIIDPNKFIALVVFSIFIFLIFFSIKKLFITYGSKRQFFDETRLNHLQNILKSIKEIKIYRRENFFFEKFKNDNNSNYFYAGKNLFLSNVPRIVIEVIVITLIIIFLVFSIINNSDLKEIDLEISMLFLAALIRFVPLVSRVNISINAMRYGQATLNLIYDELNNSNQNLPEIKKTHYNYKLKNIIEFKDVNFHFSNSTKNLFKNNLNFKFKR